MFTKRSNAGFISALNGVERKTVVHGERTLMTEFLLRKGAVLPRHTHPHEQPTDYLVSGHIRLSIGTDEFEARAGDYWCIRGDGQTLAISSPKTGSAVPCAAWRRRSFR